MGSIFGVENISEWYLGTGQRSLNASLELNLTAHYEGSRLSFRLFSLSAPSLVWSCGFRFKFWREAKRENKKGKKLQRSRKKRGGERSNQSGKMVVNSCMQKNG